MTDGTHAPQAHHDNGSGQTGTDPQPIRPWPEPVDQLRISTPAGPHNFHLLVADSGITESIPVCRIYLALCGARLTRSDLPDSMCPPECQREISYCLDCLYVANGQNIAAGLGLRAPGIYVPMSS